jgi:hypothetical protein
VSSLRDYPSWFQLEHSYLRDTLGPYAIRTTSFVTHRETNIHDKLHEIKTALQSERQEKLVLKASLAMLPDIQAAIQQQRADNILMAEYLARMNAGTQTSDGARLVVASPSNEHNKQPLIPASGSNSRVDLDEGLGRAVNEGHLEIRGASDDSKEAIEGRLGGAVSEGHLQIKASDESTEPVCRQGHQVASSHLC